MRSSGIVVSSIARSGETRSANQNSCGQSTKALRPIPPLAPGFCSNRHARFTDKPSARLDDGRAALHDWTWEL
jgi:hypothetical protein